jgi:hypothetical protein
MILTDILSSERVKVAVLGSGVESKDDALHALAKLLASGSPSAAAPDFYRVLAERETLQSTASATASPFRMARSKT